MRRRVGTASLAILTAAAGQPPPTTVTTVPFETLRRCFQSQWAQTGRITAINTAAGAMLDLSFPTVGGDGKVGTGHAMFSIEDRGIERRVTATAADPEDAALAQQMLDRTMENCAAEAARR